MNASIKYLPVRTPIRARMLSTEFATARRQLVAAALHMAGCDWSTDEDDSAARTAFENALTSMMAEVAPEVTVAPYGTGEPPVDRAYRNIQAGALHLAYAEFDNGYETRDAAAYRDFADDRLDEALDGYIAAALAAAKS